MTDQPSTRPAPQRVMVVGATSDIGRAIARHYAASKADLVLTARDTALIQADARDLHLRHGVEVQILHFDVLAPQSHTALLAALTPLPDIVICVVGLLGDQKISEHDPEAARIVMETNYIGPALLLGELANRFEARGSGTLVGISSVAGERGRASNYIYGSAKAGFTAFLSGLRARLARTPVHVLTVLPGYVHTRMTADMSLPKALTSSPDAVSERIRKAVNRKENLIYISSIWTFIMCIIKLLPEALFKKLKI